LFSAIGLARTHRAHWAPDGSASPGGSVWKYAGPAPELAAALP
jgi:hypothetical protein